METYLTILVDNFAGRRGTVAEHGFSAWITHGSDETLFDTGAGQALPINVKALNKDLHALQRIVLSHGHWDHTGGLPYVLNVRQHTPILAHPSIFEQHLARRTRHGKSYYEFVGLPTPREALEGMGAQFELHRDYHEIVDGLWFSGEIIRPPGWNSSDAHLTLKQGAEYIPDPILDDISLLIETRKGPVVLLGCAHTGVEVILPFLAEQSGFSTFYAVIGGTHLVRADERRLNAVIEVLEQYQVQQIVTSHCTGFPAMAHLSRHFQKRFTMATVGAAFQF